MNCTAQRCFLPPLTTGSSVARPMLAPEIRKDAVQTLLTYQIIPISSFFYPFLQVFVMPMKC